MSSRADHHGGGGGTGIFKKNSTYRRSIIDWFRHKGDYDTQKNASSPDNKTSDRRKKKNKNIPGSLSNTSHLSDSLPSLDVRSPTSNQPLHAYNGHGRSRLSTMTTVPEVAKRSPTSETRRTISGRNRWSSYELAAVALAAEQATVDDNVCEPTATRTENALAVSQTGSAETAVGVRQVTDPDTSQDGLHEAAPDSSMTKDSTPKSQSRNPDEIFERLRLVDDQIESCRTRKKHLLATLSRNNFAAVGQLASQRSRDDDRCAVLLSLLSDAERLTSCINSLLCLYEEQHKQEVSTTNGKSSDIRVCPPRTGNSNAGCTTSGLAKTLADVSLNLRSQLTQLSESNVLQSSGHVQQTNAGKQLADENNTHMATDVVATSGECNDNNLPLSPPSYYYGNCTDCRLNNCSDVFTVTI